MTTFALIHGSGDGGWAWHLVQDALAAHGHDSVAPDLPSDRDDATWDDLADAVVHAVQSAGGAGDVVVVGQSAGGFVVPLVADRLVARLQVYLAGLVPRPGETASEWFGNVGWSEDDLDAEAEGGVFYHDVPAALAAQATARERPTSDRLGELPWPGPALPAVPARYVVTTRDRFLPPAVQRRVAAQRLTLTRPDTIDAGHCPHLSRPEEVAALLAGYVGRPH